MPLNSSVSMKRNFATDKSKNDLEVDKILLHSKIEEDTTKHRANQNVSTTMAIDSPIREHFY